MAEPHHRRTVGYSMIVVSASLVGIALLYLAIGENVLFADEVGRAKTATYENCKETDFVGEECQKFIEFVTGEKCVANRDLESPECYKFRTLVENSIFEECRANRDVQSPLCQKYEGTFPLE